MRSLSRVTWAGFGLACALAVVGIVMAFQPNLEGWLGGLLFAAFYAAPVALVALCLRSHRHWLRTAAGWMAAALALFYAAIPVGNWSGYTSQEAIFAVSITVPAVLFYVAAFWTVVVRHAGRSPASLAH